jgi:hypothetical protein
VSAAGSTVEALLEHAPTCAVAAGRDGIAQAFAAASSPARCVVVLDAGRRPLELVPRGDGRRRPLLKVDLRESLAGVARRAMARPPEQRFDPVVCCDARGRYAGVVSVERLVEGLAALTGRA